MAKAHITNFGSLLGGHVSTDRGGYVHYDERKAEEIASYIEEQGEDGLYAFTGDASTRPAQFRDADSNTVAIGALHGKQRIGF